MMFPLTSNLQNSTFYDFFLYFAKLNYFVKSYDFVKLFFSRNSIIPPVGAPPVGARECGASGCNLRVRACATALVPAFVGDRNGAQPRAEDAVGDGGDVASSELAESESEEALLGGGEVAGEEATAEQEGFDDDDDALHTAQALSASSLLEEQRQQDTQQDLAIEQQELAAVVARSLHEQAAQTASTSVPPLVEEAVASLPTPRAAALEQARANLAAALAAQPGANAPFPLQEESMKQVQQRLREVEALEAPSDAGSGGGLPTLMSADLSIIRRGAELHRAEVACAQQEVAEAEKKAAPARWDGEGVEKPSWESVEAGSLPRWDTLQWNAVMREALAFPSRKELELVFYQLVGSGADPMDMRVLDELLSRCPALCLRAAVTEYAQCGAGSVARRLVDRARVMVDDVFGGYFEGVFVSMDGVRSHVPL